MKPETTADWKVYIRERLDMTQFMALATVGEKGPWVNPVYFAFDDMFTLYFLSELHSLHMQNIDRNPAVSCAVYSTMQSPVGKVVGLQIRGNATLVPPGEAEHATLTYFSPTPARTPIDRTHTPRANEHGSGTWQMARVVPTEIYCFDEAVFGSERVQVPHEALL